MAGVAASGEAGVAILTRLPEADTAGAHIGAVATTTGVEGTTRACDRAASSVATIPDTTSRPILASAITRQFTRIPPVDTTMRGDTGTSIQAAM